MIIQSCDPDCAQLPRKQAHKAHCGLSSAKLCEAMLTPSGGITVALRWHYGMHCKISKTIADGLTPTPGAKPKPAEVFDKGQPGLILRVQPSGIRTWYFDYRIAGKRKRYRIGAYPGLSIDGARTLAKRLAGKVASDIDPQSERKQQRVQAQRDQVNTLQSFITARYEPYARTHLKSHGIEQLKRIRADFKGWLDKPIREITREMADSWRSAQLQRGKQPASVNRDLYRMRAVLTRAVDWKLIDRHPFANMPALKVDRTGRIRYLSADEETRLRKALLDREADLRKARDSFNAWRAERHQKLLPGRDGDFIDHVRPMVLMALNTGLRRGELLSLRWRHVNAEGRTVEVEGATAKTGQTRHVPLNTETLELLNGWRQHCKAKDEDFVFSVHEGRRMNSVKHAWATVATDAALNGFRFHDLRHHFASRLVMAGQPLNTVRTLLGHSTITLTERYAHLAPGNLRAAIDAVDPRKKL
jgi:integrase